MQPDSPLTPLDAEIAAAQSAVAKAQGQLRTSLAILEVLERLKFSQGSPGQSQKMPPPIASSYGAPEGSPLPNRRGKAPGSLSSQWRKIMAKIVAAGNDPMDPDYWCIAASEAGFPNMEVKAARDWLRRAAANEYGFILKHGDSFNVSDAAIEKFHLRTPKPSPEAPSDGFA